MILKVSIALTKSFDKYNRAGWVRANKMPPMFAEEKKNLIKKNIVLKEKFKVLDAEVTRQKRKLDLINHHLEEIIDERTKDLQIKNKKLSELTSYLSNQIRGPIATLKGLLNLEKEGLVDKPECIKMMNRSVSEIDERII